MKIIWTFHEKLAAVILSLFAVGTVVYLAYTHEPSLTQEQCRQIEETYPVPSDPDFLKSISECAKRFG